MSTLGTSNRLACIYRFNSLTSNCSQSGYNWITAILNSINVFLVDQTQLWSN